MGCFIKGKYRLKNADLLQDSVKGSLKTVKKLSSVLPQGQEQGLRERAAFFHRYLASLVLRAYLNTKIPILQHRKSKCY